MFSIVQNVVYLENTTDPNPGMACERENEGASL